jgi:hypothetical protein
MNVRNDERVGPEGADPPALFGCHRRDQRRRLDSSISVADISRDSIFPKPAPTPADGVAARALDFDDDRRRRLLPPTSRYTARRIPDLPG